MHMISWGWLQGEITASVQGTASQRFFSLLLQNGIACRRLEETEGQYRFIHAYKDRSQIRYYAKKTGMRYTSYTEKGLPSAKRYLLHSPAVLIALLAILLILTSLSCFIWRIEITGNAAISEEEILSRLEEMEIHIGKWKGSIDTKELTHMMLKQYTDLSFVSLSIAGSTLKVRVTERTEEPDFPYLMNENGSLVATGDYIVYSIVADQGTPMVRKGDVVHKGDILISGYVTSVSDDGITTYHAYPARGTVLGERLYTLSDSIKKQTERRVYEDKPRNALVFFYNGKQIYLWKPFRNDENCDIISTPLWSAGLFGGASLSIDHEEYWSYRSYEYEYTEEEMENLLAERIHRSLEKWLADGRRVVTTQHFECRTMADGMQAVLTVKAIEDIAEWSPLEELPQEEDTE